MLDQIYKEVKEHMHKSVEAVQREFSTVRTGKATPQLVSTVMVEAYGSMLPLNQVATVSVPEPRLLVIQAFDKGTVGDIVKGIQKADLGLNPAVDGQVVRVAIPPLNEDRRKDLVRHCKNLAEDGRIACRNIRRDANDKIKVLEKAHDISEDQEADGHDEVQKITNDSIKEIDDLLKAKESDVMEV